MARRSGRHFLEYLAGAKLFKPAVKSILADAWDERPHFNPQKRHAKRLSKEELLDSERLKDAWPGFGAPTHKAQGSRQPST